MKKIYSLFALLLLSVVSFAASAKTINVGCNTAPEKVVLRDGGADGAILDVTFEKNEYTPVEIETSLYVEVTDPELILSSVVYNYWYQGTVIGNTCNIDADSFADETYVEINVQAPKYVTVNVPDPELVTILPGRWADDDEAFELTTGANKLRLGQYVDVYITLNDADAYRLTRVYRVSDNKSFSIDKFTSCSLSSYDTEDGDVISYVVVPADEFEAPTFKVRVDDPDKVTVSLGYDNEITGLVANEWKAVEMSGNSTSVSVRNNEYGTDLYSVKLNGVEQNGYYGSYNIYDVMEGDEIDVKVDFPDEDYTVTISADPAECIGVITGVSIDGDDVDWQDGLTVHCGKKLKFTLNKDMYDVKGIKINGVDQDVTYLWSSYEVKIMENTSIVFEAEKKPTFTFILNVDHADAIVAKVNWNQIALHDGENVIEYAKDSNKLTVGPAFLAVINSMKITVEDPDDGKIMEINVPDGKIDRYLDETVKSLDVEAELMTRDKKFVAWFDTDITKGNYFYFYSDQDENSTNHLVGQGYNVIEFLAQENPYYLNWGPRDEKVVIYQNGEEVEPNNWGSYDAFTFEDGDVLKVFTAGTPETFSATFAADDDSHFTMKKDILTPVEDFSAPVSDFAGTLFTLVPEAEYELEVVVTDAAVAAAAGEDDEESEEVAGKVLPNEDGNYEFVLDGDKNVSIKANPLTGIETVNAAAVKANTDVYTVGGVLVLRNATPAQIKALPAGIYVVGGQKFVQK